ncbi:magnesium-translocating P-type ATPase [Acaricomes phytoseiuli]|uniref:magnesium-translocating P-type ATPase n=1 Tax=Acaricomes phytoseiuli TaxID=291968 RepID=UPI00035E10B6|nr:magnesium-translocating P-type ATPase [Acaricomes phytoseiuli]MCW1249954.1 magnesium-translocating P-type ATPase [Acaricomes phytoseiuli]
MQITPTRPAAPPGSAGNTMRTDALDQRNDRKTQRRNARLSARLAERAAILAAAATTPNAELLEQLGTSHIGLDVSEIQERQERYGRNEVSHDRPAPAWLQFLSAFNNPFVWILCVLAAIMFVTNVLLASPEDGQDYKGVLTLSVMVLVSVTMRFWQEYRSGKAAQALQSMVQTTTAATRQDDAGNSVTREIPIEDVVPGDIVELAAGDMIPADVRFLRTKDLQVNEGMLTGESLPTEKSPVTAADITPVNLLDADTLGFMGTSVISGSGTAVVVHTGAETYFGAMSAQLAGKRPETSFDAGVKRVSFLLIKFMLVMVPVVFIINGITKNWSDAFLFGLVTAVGLTPEMLPMIVTANLARGAVKMSRHKVIVKRLNAIQNLGAMDVLCTDKTGTLTEDRIVLERHLDTRGTSSLNVLRMAAANARFQTGLRNLLDRAVLDAAGPQILDELDGAYTLVDEVPFDFSRRRMTVILTGGTTPLMITKGAAEEVMEVCTAVMVQGKPEPLTAERQAELNTLVETQNAEGMRVLALAVRNVPADRGEDYSVVDEREMTLMGFLAFLDPPKASAASAVEALRNHGTSVKVITGDNELVARTVCRQVGIDTGVPGAPQALFTGAELEELDEAAFAEAVEAGDVFAKVNPMQKARIVEQLQRAGHTVGFMGDGINDAAALRAADVGISVDTAVDIARESADIILLEKDLMVLEAGIQEGRRTFGNIMKYLKMTASSNFGNMFSILVASATLPFLPMIPVVVLLMNLVYDLSMLSLPWDRVDKEYLEKPQKWETRGLARFMVQVGPLSSIFDISTFALMWFVFGANSPENAGLFQTGWFVESLITQTFIVHMLRTGRIPFVQSRASWPVMVATGAVCLFALMLPFLGFGQSLGLVALPWTYFPWLLGTLLAYCLVVQGVKTLYIRRYGRWL